MENYISASVEPHDNLDIPNSIFTESNIWEVPYAGGCFFQEDYLMDEWSPQTLPEYTERHFSTYEYDLTANTCTWFNDTTIGKFCTKKNKDSKYM